MALRYLLLGLLCAAVSGCATYREDLNRSQRLYEDSEYERALAVLRYLEVDMDSLTHNDQARYAYLRGMTDYRLGGGDGGDVKAYRRHARHWLAIAKAIDEEHPGGLRDQWRTRLNEALDDLNEEVYGLSSTDPPGAGDPEDAAAEPEAESSESEPLDPGECRTNDDCTEGETCQANECVVI